ncbi:MAG TPA: hypothetical protein VHK70_10675 [Burkholderiaceae bacterium]|nr:hypothetical protein [Burkholderiaceae bacterium]
MFLPLLIYNTAMGIAYVAAGVVAWLNPARGKRAAATIFALNLLMLAGIVYLYTEGGHVAVESLRAMALRTVVWLMLFLWLSWVSRRNRF